MNKCAKCGGTEQLSIRSRSKNAVQYNCRACRRAAYRLTRAHKGEEHEEKPDDDWMKRYKLSESNIIKKWCI